MLRISANTRLMAVIGDPIRHSLSPMIHNRFIEASGLDFAYLAFTVRAGGARDFIEAARVLDIAGFNVTMPLKEECFRLLDFTERGGSGAVNTVVLRDGAFYGYNTDGGGFLAALGRAGFSPEGKNAVVLGAGGAAKALAGALTGAGAGVTVCARDTDKARGIVERAVRFSNAETGALAAVCGDAALLVNATPIGMEGFDGFASFAFLDSLPKGALVYDSVYAPRVTPLLAEAAARGIGTLNGLSYLLHQAALSFGHFTGVTPDEETMDAILRDLYKL